MATPSLPPPNGASLVRTSSGEQAALYVRQLIFDGHLTPGSRVPQDEIARTLGISRIPLREALIALEREGWVTLEMHRGAFVNALDERAVRDHYELFGQIYGFTLQKAMERSGDDYVERLAAVDREIRSETNPSALSPLLMRFHTTMTAGAQSTRINAVLRSMSSIVPGDFFEQIPGAIEIERSAIAEIVRAVQRGDAERGARKYEEMMGKLAESVASVLRDRGLFELTEAASVDDAAAG
jgi:DNA-binding GntR family transcriptional regulator